MREGEPSEQMFYLQRGSVGIFKQEKGSEVQIGTLYTGAIVGEMSFLSQETRQASVKAMSDCLVTVISRERYDKNLKAMPAWGKELIRTLFIRLRQAHRDIRV